VGVDRLKLDIVDLVGTDIVDIRLGWAVRDDIRDMVLDLVAGDRKCIRVDRAVGFVDIRDNGRVVFERDTNFRDFRDFVVVELEMNFVARDLQDLQHLAARLDFYFDWLAKK
jgi:hypothetical protein